MSILYEALKKAEQEKSATQKSRRSSDHTTFIDRVKQLEDEQQKAIHERVKIATPKMARKQKRMLLSVALLGMLALGAGGYYAVTHGFFGQPQAVTTEPAAGTVNAEEAVQPAPEGAAVPAMPAALKNEAEATSVQLPREERAVVVTPIKQNTVKPVRKTTAPVVSKKTPAVPKQEFSCSGTVLDTTGNFCVINGSVLRVGDTINGARITDIANTEVTMERNGKRIVVPLVV